MIIIAIILISKFTNVLIFKIMKRLFTLLFLCASALNLTTNAQVTFTAAGTTSSASAWLTAGNWGGTAPTSSQIAAFAANPSASVTTLTPNTPAVGINMNTATSVIGGANSQAVGAIQVTSARSTNLMISNSSTTKGGTLYLTGASIGGNSDAVVDNQGTGVLTIATVLPLTTPTLATILSLPATATFSGGSSSTTVLTCAVTGAATMLTNASGTLRLNKTGGSTLLAVANVSVTGGTLQISTNQTLNNLTVNGGTVTVDNGVTLTINGVLTLTSGKITLGTTGTGNVVAAAISGGSSTSYVVTNGTGTLTQPAVTAGTLYPIGSSSTSYDPVTLAPATPRSFSASVKGALTNPLGSSPTNPGLIVNREWNITGTQGATDITFGTSATCIDGTNTRPAGNTGLIGHWNGTSWDDVPANYMTPNVWQVLAYAGTFSPFIVGAPGAVLSAELQNITVKSKNNMNVLTWSTASEKDNALFQIERANDGTNFQNIGNVKGNGTTSAVSNYTFEDATPSVGTNYYRLRQVDANGAEKLSKVVSVELGKTKNTVSIYPTIASDKININAEENTVYSVFNLYGQNVLNGQLNDQKELNISPLTAGIYVLKIGNSTIKFTKIN